MSDPEKNDVTCPVCQKVFTSEWHYNKHANRKDPCQPPEGTAEGTVIESEIHEPVDTPECDIASVSDDEDNEDENPEIEIEVIDSPKSESLSSVMTGSMEVHDDSSCERLEFVNARLLEENARLQDKVKSLEQELNQYRAPRTASSYQVVYYPPPPMPYFRFF